MQRGFCYRNSIHWDQFQTPFHPYSVIITYIQPTSPIRVNTGLVTCFVVVAFFFLISGKTHYSIQINLISFTLTLLCFPLEPLPHWLWKGNGRYGRLSDLQALGNDTIACLPHNMWCILTKWGQNSPGRSWDSWRKQLGFILSMFYFIF